ncbi:hypothetical protein STAFG_5914 [Streptomyces afghaniensis 772]|uniref:Uncharacterized protein n=1 Tax=Streptomyces afghaniensis 772 TaxID=1283301 RepID=S4MN82_9ACTN|nr:hypothetical protein STAFG_5914 [Streptomyces afghaniensis 772]
MEQLLPPHPRSDLFLDFLTVACRCLGARQP